MGRYRDMKRPALLLLVVAFATTAVWAESEAVETMEYLKEGINAGGRRASIAQGAYSWGSSGAGSSNRAGNDEALVEEDKDESLGEPGASNQIRLLKRENE